MSDDQRAALYGQLGRDLRVVLYRRWPALRDIHQAREREARIAEDHKRRPAREFSRRPGAAYWRGM